MTDILDLSTSTLWWITGILLFSRIYDAVDDPVMGFLVDNTNTKYGKFKPWITNQLHCKRYCLLVTPSVLVFGPKGA